MKERLVPVAILLCCLFALTASAGSIESAVSTNPDEVIDYDSRLLPIGVETVADLKQKVQGGGGSPDSEGDEPMVTQSDSGTPRQSNVDSEMEDRATQHVDSRSESVEETQSKSNEKESSSASTGPGRGLLPAFDWFQWLLGLLKTVLFALLLLVPAAATAVVAYRRRDDLLARLDDLAAAGSDAGPESSALDARPDPSNGVEAAWYRMLDEFDLDDVRAKAPEECAQEVIERGAERTAVRPLTEAFTEVRYGGAPVTESRRERAREALRLCVQDADGEAS